MTEDPLAAIRSGQPVLGIGLISGTSADGIDATAVELRQEQGRVRLEVRAFLTHPYPAEVRDALFRCFEDRATVSEVCLLNAALGELFADAAEAVLREAGQAATPAFAASHGQTVWHQPFQGIGERGEGTERPTPNAQRPLATHLHGTLQLGEAARIAERLRVPVVGDFRQQDIALGGQGAPLVPYLDLLLFSHPHKNRAAQNIGGIGNVTYLRTGGGLEDVVAFDTGPGNAWIDAAAVLASEGALQCDLDGRLAASAPVDEELLARLLAEPYLSQPPPKSTGRELFGAGRVRPLWDAGVRGPALVSTLTQLTVESIARAYEQWLGPVDEVIVGGGGARNPELVRRLRERLAPAAVYLNDDFGISSDAKEAVAFALLGYETLRGIPSNVPSATGASRPAVLGKICFP